MPVLLGQWILTLFEKRISWLQVQQKVRSIFGILIQIHRQLSLEVNNQRMFNILLGTSKVLLLDYNQRNCMLMLRIVYFYGNLILEINISFLFYCTVHLKDILASTFSQYCIIWNVKEKKPIFKLTDANSRVYNLFSS